MRCKEAYSTKKLCVMFDVTKKALLERADREDWRSRPRQGRGGGHEWLVASMPEGTRIAIDAALAKNMMQMPLPLGTTVAGSLVSTKGAAPIKAGSSAVSASSHGNLPSFERKRSIPIDVAVPDWSWDTAKARYVIRMKWREHVCAVRKKGIKTKEATQQFLALYASGLAVPEPVREHIGNVTASTLYRWDKTLKDGGGFAESLADKRGGWLDGRAKGLGQIGEDAEKAFLAVYLRRNQPSVMFAYNCMAAYLEQHELKVPSYSSVCRFLERFDGIHHDLVVWMREGEKAYHDKVGTYLSRDDSVLRVGDVLVADGHKMNFTVLNPDTGKPCRMTLIGWQDWASRMFVGFELMVSENTQAISAAFYNSIVNLGKLPGSVYLDNGAAFKNKFFDGDPNINLEDFAGLYARLGVSVSHSLPYVARTKIIERWWRDFDQQCAVAAPSYVGRDIAHKPAHLRLGETWARVQHKKEDWVPTVEDVKRMVIGYARWKAQQPHPTRPGTTPLAVFMAGRGPGFDTGELERLSRQFLYRQVVHPKRCRFAIRGVEFESDALHGINMKLTAYYSYSDVAQVYVYDNGRYVCTARPVATYHPMAKLYGTELDLEKVTAAQKEQARLKNQTRRLASELTAKGLPQAAEVMQALPFNLSRPERRTPLVLHGQGASLPAPDVPELTNEERAELLAIAEEARGITGPAYEVPAFFSSRLDRYEYLFNVLFEHGLELRDEDAAFMSDYESSLEFESARPRYDHPCVILEDI